MRPSNSSAEPRLLCARALPGSSARERSSASRARRRIARIDVQQRNPEVHERIVGRHRAGLLEQRPCYVEAAGLERFVTIVADASCVRVRHRAGDART